VTLQTYLIALASGLGLGSIYVLVSVSYTLILASSGVFNFAQGALVMGGTIVSYVMSTEASLPLWLTVPVIVLGGAAAGALSELVAVRPFVVWAQNLTEETLVSTLGLGLAMTAIASLAFGTDPQPTNSYVTTTPIIINGVPIRPIFLAMLIIGALVIVALEIIMAKTQLGIVFRATTIDREGAAGLGINYRQVIAASFVVAGALAGLAGFLLAPVTTASVSVGNNLALLAFVGMAMGGFGSFRGVIVGGMLVGLITAFVPVFTDPLWTRPILYAVMIALLLLRPSGLFGRKGQFGSQVLRDV
jgi:branched-chain amino acid transport system permease protein